MLSFVTGAKTFLKPDVTCQKMTTFQKFGSKTVQISNPDEVLVKCNFSLFWIKNPSLVTYIRTLMHISSGLRSRRFLGGVGILRTQNTSSRSRIFYLAPTPEVQLNHFLYRTPKLGILTRCLWKWKTFFWNFYWNREFLLCTTIYVDR